MNLQQAVALGGFAFYAAWLIGMICYAGWREVAKRGKNAAMVFFAFAAVATVTAQKPPVVRAMHLRIYNVTAKGFDCAWDYGDLAPADFTDGETVRLTAEVAGMDYQLIIGTLPPSVTNYHVNAVLRGLPRDWMRHNILVTARVNNSLLTGSAIYPGERREESGDNGIKLPDLPAENGGEK